MCTPSICEAFFRKETLSDVTNNALSSCVAFNFLIESMHFWMSFSASFWFVIDLK